LGLPQQFKRSRAQKHEAPRATNAVDFTPQHRKQLRRILNFVQDHQSVGMRLQEQWAFSQSGTILRGLQIKINGVWMGFKQTACKGCLSNLART
jgi:hypothetical protein